MLTILLIRRKEHVCDGCVNNNINAEHVHDVDSDNSLRNHCGGVIIELFTCNVIHDWSNSSLNESKRKTWGCVSYWHQVAVVLIGHKTEGLKNLYFDFGGVVGYPI